MATLPELLAQAEIIRTAQNVDENTAQRIGKLYNDIIVYFSNNGGTGGVTSHLALNDKNAETAFQHVDTTITKETLVNDDKITIYDSVTGKVVLTDKNNIKASFLQNVTANTFVADITYLDFPFKCEIAVTGVTSANNAEVTFSLTQAMSGDLAPICVTDTNKVIIYAKSDLGSIVIPLIKVEVVI